MNIGRIVSLKIYPEKGKPGVVTDRIQLLRGLGIAGDHFAARQGRQVSLLDLDTRKWMASQTVKGPCFDRFRENILTDGMDFDELAEGCTLQVGTGVLVITQCGKRCFSECPRLQAGLPCRLKEAVRYARVESSGEATIRSELRAGSDAGV